MWRLVLGGKMKTDQKINKKQVLNWVIPVFAVIVIFQAVILVTNSLTPAKTATQVASSTATKKTEAITPVTTELNLSLVSPEEEWQVGKTTTVTLKVTANTRKAVDAMDLYIKYDPAAFKVTDLTVGEGLPKPASSKISPKTGLIVANIYISGTSSFNLEKAVDKDLITFKVTPQRAGDFNFEIDTGKTARDSVTMLVEAKTAKVIPFTAETFKIKVK